MSDNFNLSNRGNIFDPVVSIEAWRAKCSAEEQGSVHVDITFLEALLGDEPDSQVRFRVSLQRALVRLYISPRDPIKVVRDSVDRGEIIESTLSTLDEKSTGCKVDAHAAISTSANPLVMGGKVAANLGRARTQTVQSERRVRSFDVEQYFSDGSYCWEVKPRESEALLGKVWDAVNEPRLKTKMTNTKERSADCEIRVIVECRRQDILIRDVQLKEKRLQIFRNERNNIVAAEAVIRELMLEKGFKTADMTEPFARVSIASLSIPEE